jgi:hypothetical protein
MKASSLALALLFTLAACKDDSDDVGDDSTITGTDSDTPDDTNAPDDTSAPTDNDGDGVPAEEDCDDNDASVFPGAAETCDGLDNNCDGSVDEGALSTFYVDGDGDGYGDTAQPIEACEAPEGASALGDDCDDEDAAFNPGASETDCDDPNDYNCDGSTGYADGDGDGFAACQECDDGDAAVNPDAAEVCDERDNNCDGATDEGVTSTFYQDRDADTYGDVDFPAEACSAPSGYTADSTDCDDDAGAVNPGATEVCNDLDDDCDALIDGDDDSLDSASATSFYSDEDGDGFGDPASVVLACDAPSGAVTDNTDCDDSESDVYPGAVETCDGEDDDCDGSVDEEATDFATYYADADNDGYGDADYTVEACSPPTGYVANTEDCDDGDSAVNPAASEVCDSQDNNCDGLTDDSSATDAKTYYADVDADGDGDPSSTIKACTRPSGYIGNKKDCDDGDAAISSKATEICDSQDNDCDGTIDESDASDASTYYLDADNDGYGTSSSTTKSCSLPTGYSSVSTDCRDSDSTAYPGATEVCDGVDDDCDGDADEGLLGTGASCAAVDCAEILADNPSAADGSYTLYVGSSTSVATYYCDMTTDGGGWTRVKEAAHVYGTSYDTSYYNSEGFTWQEALFAYNSGSVSAHCSFPGSMTGCNPIGFQFGSANWGVALNWGSSLCGMSTTSYTAATTYVGGYDWVIDYGSSTTTTIRLGTLEGVAGCTTSDNPGTPTSTCSCAEHARGHDGGAQWALRRWPAPRGGAGAGAARARRRRHTPSRRRAPPPPRAPRR